MKVAVINEDEMVTLEIMESQFKAFNSNDVARQAFLNHINDSCKTEFRIGDTEIIDLAGKHLCQYCGEVVDGEYEDLLCEDCRMTFGHALYSEL
jgi:hypothetical protein